MHLTERPSGDFPNRWIEKMKSMIEDPRWEQASELYDAQKWADALSLFKELADDGITAAYGVIAHIYEYGYNGKYGQDRGVKENPVEAFKWHTKAYEAGYGLGAVGLARMLIAGNGVERDYEKAFHYLTQARKGHLAEVYRNLGTLYDTGKGVGQDFKKAKLRFFRFLVEAPWVKESAMLMNFQQKVCDVSVPIGHSF